MFSVARQRLQLPQASVEDWLGLPASERRRHFAAADLRASLTATSFEATLLKNFNREAVSRELADLVVRAKEDGTARQPKLNQSLNRLIAMKQRADAGDPLASGDFAREYDVFIHDLTRLKIEALLNSPE